MPVLRRMQRLANFYIDVRALRPGTVGAYAFALVCAGVATALRVAVDLYVAGVQYITFFPAIMITTLISGFGAGVFCVALSAAAAAFFVLPPRLSFYVEHPAEVLALLIFILITLSNVILISGMRSTLIALRESQDRLGSIVAELQHRTRNLISIVSVVADRTLRASKTSDDFRASFQDRLGVLGRAQGLLFRAEGRRVTFDELIDTELAAQSVRGGENGSVTLDDPKSRCSALPYSSIPGDGLA